MRVKVVCQPYCLEEHQYFSTPKRSQSSKKLTALFDNKNILPVKISFLEQICPTHCKSSAWERKKLED